MRRIWICAIVAVVAMAFVSTSVVALPAYSQKTGKSCAYCHKDPKGGKELTPAGQYYKKNKKLPPEPGKSAAKPEVKKPAPKKPAAKPAKKAGAGKGPTYAPAKRAAPMPRREEAPLK